MIRYFLLSFGICAIVTPLIIHFAHAKKWVAHPSEDRWHKKTTPTFGGIAIFIAIIIPLIWLTNFKLFYAAIINDKIVQFDIYPLILIGASFIFLLGLFDDILHVKPHTKLICQIIAASFMAFVGYRLNWFTSLTLDTIVTIIWIVGLSNAFNLLDNMDGLCAGSGVATSMILFFFFRTSLPDIAIVSLILAGALGGFLLYNFNPAKIFMGDCGSLTIGYLLAILSLNYSQLNNLSNNFNLYIIPILIFIVPILDTTMVTFVRILSGRKAYIGGKDHTSHRLVIMGFSERGAVLVLYGIAFTSGLSALFVHSHDSYTSPIVIIPFLISVFLIAGYMAQVRVYPEKEFCLLRGRRFSPLLEDLTYKRQLLMVILDFCIIAFSYYLSYRLRFSNELFINYFPIFLRSLPAVIVCKYVAFLVSGVYQGIWRYISINDLSTYLKGNILASLLTVAVVTYIYRFEDFSKGIFIIDMIVILFLQLLTRVSFRLFSDVITRKTAHGDKVLIYGAGRGGELLLRELLYNKKYELKPIGFIDDNKLKIGKKIQGYPVLGTIDHLMLLCNRFAINGILISFHELDTASHIKSLKQFCNKNGIYIKHFSIELQDIQ